MKKLALFAAVAALALAAVPSGPAVADPGVDPLLRGRPYRDCPEGTGRQVTFSCVPGAAAGVAGIYGGTTFGLFCNGDGSASQTTQTICTKPGDTTWGISGAASLRNGAQVRFATSGSGRTAHYRVGNGEVRLNILP